jgi:hypothetical protein
MEYLIWSKQGGGVKAKFLRDVKSVAEKFCVQGSVGVSPSYAVRYSKNDADVILVGYQEEEARAFILATYEEDSLYLGVICGMPGTGKAIMEKFLNFADSQRVNVSLSAMPNVLSYYGRPEFGFKFRKSCDEGAESVDSSSIDGKKPPLNLEEIAHDPFFGPFLVELQTKGFNVVKTGECAKRRLTADDIIKNHCEDDGYTMFRCRVPVARGSKKSPRKTKSKAPLEPRELGKRVRRSPSRYND